MVTGRFLNATKCGVVGHRFYQKGRVGDEQGTEQGLKQKIWVSSSALVLFNILGKTLICFFLPKIRF